MSLSYNLISRVNVGDAITRAADLFPEKAAVIGPDGAELTYREFEVSVNRLGRALLELGLERGDVVGVLARNCAEILLVYLACARAGLVFAPMNLGLKGEDIAYCLADADARVLIAETEFGDMVRGFPADLPALQHLYWIGADAPAAVPEGAGMFPELMARGSPEPLEVFVDDRDGVQLLYTSGTTSRPKGVVTSHVAVMMSALSGAIAHGMVPGRSTTALVSLPLFHCAMLNGNVMPLFTVGGTAVLQRGFDPEVIPDLIERYRINHLTLLPVMYANLLQQPGIQDRDLSSVVRAGYAMAPMSEERLRALHALFPNADVVLGAGQTEFTPAACRQRAEHQWSKAASWGTATAMTRIGIMNDQGRLLPPGEIGEVVYRGPQVMNGYLNQPDQTAESFRFDWFHSGDMAWMDEDGGVWFTDRKKDVIKTGGENVASIEVERCLLAHPGVADAAVIGLHHPRWGEAITAIVIPQSGVKLERRELDEHCRSRLAGFKVPKRILVEDELPRTGTGKVQKHILRTRLKDLYAENAISG
ncbi:MAG: AMP-binding protein [Ectothiorhodospiraceae bacterium]|nr:AMP-binding protein [Ectothiorhodospiraceae bacterium]